MATYEDLKNANLAIRTTELRRKDKDGNIITKDYAEVNQRIKAFRMVYPEGTIQTDMISNDGGVCVFRAIVKVPIMQSINGEWVERERVLGTGTAYEKEGSSNINKTSYIENCETSAVGRALGMCGFGIDTSVASLEEVQTAMLQQKELEEQKEEPTQEAPQTATPNQLEILRNNMTEERIAKMLAFFHVQTLEELTLDQASKAISHIKKA